jgi:hypothetical protein
VPDPPGQSGFSLSSVGSVRLTNAEEAELKVLCGACGAEFEAKRSTAKFCGAACQKRAKRGATSPANEPDPNAGLVESVRRELGDAQRLDTVDGQLAIELAKQVTAAGATGIAGLSKELRTVMASALRGAEPRNEQPARDDEVDKARRRREQKARQAARRA